MRIIVLIVGVLIWMIIASIPRGSDEKKTYSWRDRTSPQVVVHDEVKGAPIKGTPVSEGTGRSAESSKNLSSKPSESAVTLSPVSPAPKGTVQKEEKIPVKNTASIAKVVGQKIVCQKRGDTLRSLILSLRHKGCELSYVKAGSKSTVARSHFSIKPCEQVRTKISKNLESAGFRCSAES